MKISLYIIVFIVRSCFERTHSVICKVWINYFCTILLVFGKIYSCLFIPNCAEIMWLPIQLALIYLLCYITLSLIIQKLFSTRSRYLRCICRRPEKFSLVHCLLVLVHIRTRQNGGRISLHKQISNCKRQCNITKAGIFMSSNSELVLLLDPKLLQRQECSIAFWSRNQHIAWFFLHREETFAEVEKPNFMSFWRSFLRN